MDVNRSTDDEMEEVAPVTQPASSTSLDSRKSRAAKTKPFANSIHKWYNDGADDGSQCILCSKLFKSKNPSPLISHLEKIHPDEHKKFLEEEKKRKASKSAISKKPSAAPTSGQQNLVDCFHQAITRKNGVKKNSPYYEKAVRSIAVAFVENSLAYRLIELVLV